MRAGLRRPPWATPQHTLMGSGRTRPRTSMYPSGRNWRGGRPASAACPRADVERVHGGGRCQWPAPRPRCPAVLGRASRPRHARRGPRAPGTTLSSHSASWRETHVAPSHANALDRERSEAPSGGLPLRNSDDSPNGPSPWDRRSVVDLVPQAREGLEEDQGKASEEVAGPSVSAASLVLGLGPLGAGGRERGRLEGALRQKASTISLGQAAAWT